MDVFKNYRDAALLAAKRASSPYWADRIADMLYHVCLKPSRDGSSAMPDHRVKIERVAKDWPLSGSIYVRRDDGQRFKLFKIPNGAFKVAPQK
jgi:hypothetical protein